MGLADDLLDQADHLAKLDDRKPKQANLRRAVSSAYYALFQNLIEAGVTMLLLGRAQDLRHQLARSFEHGHMLTAAKAFATNGTNPWLRTLGAAPSKDLKDVALLFADLQGDRHKADYDLTQTFTRANVLSTIARTRTGFAQWAKVPKNEQETFLLALLMRTR